MANDSQQGSSQTGTTSAGTTSEDGATGTKSADVPLQSLTPKYEEDGHGTYLHRLEAVVKDPLNLNIALTGRYGADKSSVLDEFQANHHRSVQRLAISSLAPGEEGETTTNDIQKEGPPGMNVGRESSRRHLCGRDAPARAAFWAARKLPFTGVVEAPGHGAVRRTVAQRRKAPLTEE